MVTWVSRVCISTRMGRDSISVQSGGIGHAGATRRARRRSRRARPYICRLTSLSLVICPSVGPFDYGSVRAAVTADRPAAMPFPNEASRLVLVSASQPGRAPTSRVRSMQWKRSMRSRATASAGTSVSIAATVTASALGSYTRCAVMRRLSNRAGGALRARWPSAFSLRRCRVTHSVTTRKPPLKPAAPIRRHSCSPLRHPASHSARGLAM